ncbi:MAG: hypothetical protein NTV98_00445 [Candidatus Roizmanbacteria bacterium]|nr:hypothetical protein [Candidatus Roizmanbacteria bacterium]
MKLKQIEEIATRQVPIWQPALLVSLLLAGYIVVPLIAKKPSMPQTNKSSGSTLGVNTIQEQLDNGINSIVKPAADQIQKQAGVVLGIAQQTVQQTVQDVASKSADQAKEFVFDNTLGKVLQNINTLPADQQDLIKKAICK